MQRIITKIIEFSRYLFQGILGDAYFKFKRGSKYLVTVVTAFDNSHFKSGIQLLTSLRNNTFVTQVVVFNLGFDELQAKQLQQSFPDVRFETFDFSSLPDFLQMSNNAGNYGWKPIIVNEVAKSTSGILIWSDAGNVFQKDLSKSLGFTLKDQIFAGRSSGTIAQYTFPSVQEYFAVTPRELGLSQVSAAYCFFRLNNPVVRELIEEWAVLAHDKDKLAPEGSSRLNHRQDQSLLALLMLRTFGLVGRRDLLRHGWSNHAAVRTHQDLENDAT